MKKIISAIATVALVAGTAVAVAPAANADGCTGNLKIAYQGPLSGPDAALGLNEKFGVKYAIDTYNKTAKKKITLAEFDDEGDKDKALPLGPQVVNDACIVAMVGPAYSGASKSVLPKFLEAGLPVITPSATNPTLFEYGGAIFHRAVLTDDFQGPAGAKWITKGLTAAKVYLVHDGQDYSKGLHDLVKASLGIQGIGGDVIEKDASDYSAVINKIKASKANAVWYSGYFPGAATFVKQLRDSGSKVRFGSGDGTTDTEFIKLAGKAAEGVYLTAPMVPLEVASPKEAAAYKKATGRAPGVYTTESIDAANFFLAAIKAGNTTRDAIQKYVSTKSFKGLAKTYKFDATGEVGGVDVNGFIIKNKKIVLMGPIR